MARWKPAPVIGGAYSDDAKAWSDQDTLNYIPVMAERGGTRSPSMLRGAPGLVVISDLGTNAPIRGTHNVEGLLLAVSSNKLFKIGNDGAATEIGTIPGVERVSMAHNQIAGGNEVAIANGLSGYVYNTATGVLAQITDEGFPGSISFDFCDGYIMGIDPGRQFGFHSNLAAATDYNTLDRYEAEGSPDKLVGQVVTHREWWLFGERTIEPYIDTGAATDTFQRASGTVIEIGAASRHAICQMDNSVFWLGNDGAVYRANGYSPVRISTHAIEQAIARCNTAQAFAFTFEDRGHKIFYLTFPDGHTWGYDAASGEWHRRASYGMDRWRINTLTKWRGAWVAGDYTNGRLYQLDWGTQNEAGEVLERRRITGVLSDSQNPVTVNGVALVFDTGVSVGDSKAPTNNPLIKPLTISGTLPQGVVNEVVDFTYATSGGVLPRVVSIQPGGALPTGLSMDATGHVTGTYSATGPFSWVTQVVDATGAVETVAQSMTVSGKVVASLNFNTSLTADPTGAVWTVESNAATDRWGLQPITVPYIAASPSKEGSAMMKCPDTANHDGTFDYWGDDNSGVKTQLGANAIAAGIDFCVELYTRLNTHRRSDNNNCAFSALYTNNGRWQFGANLGATVSIVQLNIPTGMTRTLWSPPDITADAGTFFDHTICRKGDIVSLYYKGVKYAEYSGASALSIRATDWIFVGNGDGDFASAFGWPGQFDNVRITSGWSRYDGNFTPPPVPY